MLFLQTLLLVSNKKYTEYLFDGKVFGKDLGVSHGYKHLRKCGPKFSRFAGKFDILNFLL